jgi:hypothetical protein
MAASPFVVRLHAPVLLTAPAALSDDTAAFVGAGRGLYELYAVGGTAVLSEGAVESALARMHSAP